MSNCGLINDELEELDLPSNFSVELLPIVKRADLFSVAVMLNPAEIADSTPLAIFFVALYFKPPTNDNPKPSEAEVELDLEILDN